MSEKRFSISEEELGQVSGGSLGQAGTEKPQMNAVGTIPKPDLHVTELSVKSSVNNPMTVSSWCDGENCNCMRDFTVAYGGRGVCTFCHKPKFL